MSKRKFSQIAEKSSTKPRQEKSETGLDLDLDLGECKTMPENINLYFEELNTIASGSFGRVYAARTTRRGRALHPGLPSIVAVKIIKPTNIPLLKNELAILKNIDLPHSVKYYGCYIQSDMVYIIMELVNGKDLFDFDVGALNPTEKIHIAQEVAIGIAEIHEMGIAHRDIKLENVMITTNNEVRIVDYGLSCDMIRRAESVTCKEHYLGTPGYIDPEVIPLNLKSMQLADWWSYGQLLAILFTNNFMGLWDPKSNKYRSLTLSEIEHIPNALRQVLVALTRPRTTQRERPSPAEIFAALADAATA